MLPADIMSFTGRAEQLKKLDELASREVAGGTAAVTAAICGMAGVGKTSLAVHWAHRAVDRFPDGQLYVNLRGYDPGPPVTAAEALDRFLRALGVPPAAIPTDLDDRAAEVRVRRRRREGRAATGGN